MEAIIPMGIFSLEEERQARTTIRVLRGLVHDDSESETGQDEIAQMMNAGSNTRMLSRSTTAISAATTRIGDAKGKDNLHVVDSELEPLFKEALRPLPILQDVVRGRQLEEDEVVPPPTMFFLTPS